MKNKIYRNRQVLQGKTFSIKLNDVFCEFQIKHVSNKEIIIVYPVKYDEIRYIKDDSIEGIVKEVIESNSSKNLLPLNQRAFMSSIKLKKTPIIIDGIEFKLDYITNSSLMLKKVIGMDELLESEEGSFLEIVKLNVVSNLLENPPPIEKIRMKYFYSDIFGHSGDTMHFQTLGPIRKVVSESELERNREKFKAQREKSKMDREKMKKLEKELKSDKRINTKELARHR